MDREKESPPERLPFCLDDTVGEIVRASQECPGVYYIAARKQDGKFLADEYYVVEKSSPAISKEAMAYGRMPEEDSRVLLYSFAEERRGYKIIEYEIYRYQVRHGIYADGQTSLRDIAFYNMEYHPEYFGPYDEDRNPIGEFTSDDDGYVYITADDLPDGANTSGRFYLRELEAAEGYILDKEYKTVYVRPGRTAEIEWVNEAITGQIQIYKYAAEANSVTGVPAGTPLQGAVYEIINERSGRVVDYITTDARGVAASKPLPLTRYKIREVTAPAYFQLDPTVHDVTLEYAGQIIKIAAYDKPANLKVTVTKTGNKQLLAGDSMRYDLTVANNSNVPLENFYLHDRFPTDCATAKTITTGTYNTRLNYQITYKTNYNDYRVLATNLLSTNNYAFDLSAISLMQDEVVTDVRLEFGKVPAGFASVVKPTVTTQTSANLANGYQVVNRADAGGQYMSQWETGRAAWITLIVKLNQPNLPKTGY